jgi:hypothetical protein
MRRKEITMKKLAIAAAIAAMMATPAVAQYVTSPQPYARAYVQTPAVGPFGSAYAYTSPNTVRYGMDAYAFEPDPNVRLQMNRDLLLRDPAEQ